MLILEVGDSGREWDGGGDAAPGFLVPVGQLFFREGSLVLRTAQHSEPCCFSSILAGLWPLAPVYFCDLGVSMAVVGVPRGARTRTGGEDQGRDRPDSEAAPVFWGENGEPRLLGAGIGEPRLPGGGDFGTTPHLGRDWGATPPRGGDWGATPPRGRGFGNHASSGQGLGSHASLGRGLGEPHLLVR